MGGFSTTLVLLILSRYASTYLNYFVSEPEQVYSKGRSETFQLNLITFFNDRSAFKSAISKIMNIEYDDSMSGLSVIQKVENAKLGYRLVQLRDLAEDIQINMKVIENLSIKSNTLIHSKTDPNCTFSANPFLTSPKAMAFEINKDLRGYNSLTINQKLAIINNLTIILDQFSSSLKSYTTLLVALQLNSVTEELLLLLYSLKCKSFEKMEIESVDCTPYGSGMSCNIVAIEKILMPHIEKFVPVPHENFTILKNPFYSDRQSMFTGPCVNENVCDFTNTATDECSKWCINVLKNETYNIPSPCEKYIDDRLYMYTDNWPIILQKATLKFKNGTSFQLQPPTMILASEECEVHFDNGVSIKLLKTNNNFEIIESSLSFEEREVLTAEVFPLLDYLYEYGDSITLILFILGYALYMLANCTKSHRKKSIYQGRHDVKKENKALVALLNKN